MAAHAAPEPSQLDADPAQSQGLEARVARLEQIVGTLVTQLIAAEIKQLITNPEAQKQFMEQITSAAVVPPAGGLGATQ